MSTKYKIAIPKPCKENWLEMNPVEKARFCNLCQKNVFDFTKSTDKEIIEAYRKDKDVCGRFTANQLDRNLNIPKEKSTIWIATSSAVITFLGLGTHQSEAQGKARIEQTNKGIETEEISNKKYVFNGILYDKSKKPLSEITISIKGEKESTKTDKKGKFKINLKESDVIIIDYAEEKSVDLYYTTRNSYFELDLEKNEFEIAPYEYGGKFKIRNLTFLGRLFYAIGNFFR